MIRRSSGGLDLDISGLEEDEVEVEVEVEVETKGLRDKEILIPLPGGVRGGFL